MSGPPVVFWFRRDLRLADNPALIAAAQSGPVLALFVHDDRLRRASGAVRLRYLHDSLVALDATIDGNLIHRAGNPAEVVATVAEEIGAEQVFATEDFGPYGRDRDRQTAGVLAKRGRELRLIDSAYAVRPGTTLKKSGSPYQVFTPFSRAWFEHGWARPAPAPQVRWVSGLARGVAPEPPAVAAQLSEVGERAAMKQLELFIDSHVRQYHQMRDRPAVAGTSNLSVHLKWGAIHPRQILAELDAVDHGEGPDTFATEICWRDFYADVLFHRPETAHESFNPKMRAMQFDDGPEADRRFEAWCRGRTGYPIVDAGMRQLLAVGWMHNRVRMIVASFLVKDLHLDWSRGARWFMERLADGDLASNQHGWQWVAGTGTDAAPYFRIFNPTSQAKKFDPDGDYVRRWVSELAGLDRTVIHEPWTVSGQLFGTVETSGYPLPIVDHAAEREVALLRYRALSNPGAGGC